MAEFPDIGAHCSVPECRRLDLLPIKCDACSFVLCKEHRTYESHRCTEAHKKNVQVPICPLCQQPVPIKRGEQPDIRVNEHIDQNCLSYLAKKKRSAPKCGIKGCPKRELVPMECVQCGVHFCLGHRHPTDHQCKRSNTRQNNMEKDAALAKAFQESMNINRGMDPEQMSFLLAQQLQQEEYESAFGNNGQQQSQGDDASMRGNGNHCSIS